MELIKSKLKALRSKATGFHEEYLLNEFYAQNQLLLSEILKLKDIIYQQNQDLNEKINTINKALISQENPNNLTQINLEYPVNSIPRYGYGKIPHKKLYELLNINRDKYSDFIDSIFHYKQDFLNITVEFINDTEPHWINGWFEGLDATSLYTFIRMYKPKKYYEIGSGNSTKFVRRAINNGKLDTQVLSIDPCPRAEIDKICDTVIRKPLEDVDVDIFNQLDRGDILSIDSSHRVFMNSDVTAIFLDVLPNLKPGVIVHFHDILLPFDYPLEWQERFYSEQYMLAEYLLTKSKNNVLFPCYFVHNDPILSKKIAESFHEPNLESISKNGCSFWIEI